MVICLLVSELGPLLPAILLLSFCVCLASLALSFVLVRLLPGIGIERLLIERERSVRLERESFYYIRRRAVFKRACLAFFCGLSRRAPFWSTRAEEASTRGDRFNTAVLWSHLQPRRDLLPVAAEYSASKQLLGFIVAPGGPPPSVWARS